MKVPTEEGYSVTASLLLRQPEAALTAFKKARAVTDFDDKTIGQHTADVLAALKAVQGNTTAGDAYLDFQRFGPAGRDGIAGNQDDLTDPLAKF